MRKMRFLLGALLIMDMLAILAIYFNFPDFLRGRAQVAPVSLTASVFPNNYNTLAQQLRQKEDALSGKENELRIKELSLQNTITKERNKLLFYFGAGGAILFLLIIYNFYLDYKKSKKRGFTIMKP